MSKKIILLTVLGLMLAMTGSAAGVFSLKVDLCFRIGQEPDDATWKGSDPGFESWMPWPAYADSEAHDARNVYDVGGSGIHIGIASAPYGSFQQFFGSIGDEDKICNSWIVSSKESGGNPESNTHLVMWANEGLVPGSYTVYGYHNTPDGSEPNMVKADARAYCADNVRAVYPARTNGTLDNIGKKSDEYGADRINNDWCEGVISDVNDYNIPIQHESSDANLVASVVSFTTDGNSPVWVMYHSGAGSHSVLNAFILRVDAVYKQTSGANPQSGTENVCPDGLTLDWINGGLAVENNVYFGSDLAAEIVLFEDDFNNGDVNWVSTNWTVYDSNRGDGKTDGNSHGGGQADLYSITPGSGSGTMTTVDINAIASEVGSMRVELWIKKTAGIGDGDIDLYYYDGSNWDYIKDLDTVGTDNGWRLYTDDVTASEYFISNFKLQLRSDISAGELFIDDVSVTNTWPIAAKWFMGTFEPNSYTPPELELGTTYYWRVDAVNDANGDSPWMGNTWNFTTETGQAFDPYPSDNSFSIEIYPLLTWSASCLANTHDVYLGDNLDDVNNATTSTAGIFKGNQAGTMYLGLLENAKQYYWRIDEHTDTEIIKGNVWKFFTYGGTLFHYTFDGVMDANVYDPCNGDYMVPDSTGNVAFNICRQAGGDRNVDLLTYDESNLIYNTLGTSARFNSGLHKGSIERVGLYRGAGTNQGAEKIQGIDITDLITPKYTIEMWIKLYSFFDDEVGLFRKWDRSYGLTITNDRYVHFWQAGDDPISSDANSPIILNTWHHVAAVFDSCDTVEPQKLYIDGEIAASGGTTNINPDNDDDPVTIGCKVNPLRTGDYERMTDAMDGLIDELRVSDRNLLPHEFLMRGDPALAWMPRPRNGEQEVQYDVILQWRPGDWADSHDVYFGSAYDDVNDADTTTAVIYKTTKGPNEYDPGQLDLETTYYWRIDEVDDSNEFRWKGTTWSFTVANYIIIDDMESYDPFVEMIWYYWDPGYTGAYFTGLGTYPLQPVNNGVRSMEYVYDNTDQEGYGKYSDDVLTFDSPQDWESVGVKMLSLYFYGLPDNDANNSELMYVGLRDSSNAFAKVSYDGDMNDIKVSDWQEWNIPLSEFIDANDVNMAEVEEISIGFGDKNAVSSGGLGVVYFDDIRIYPPKCVLEFGPTADISGDCIVSYPDIAIMGYEWLKSDNLLAASAPPTGPVGHWEMDEGIDANVADSSGNNYNGTAEGDYSWVAGRIGSSAIEFTGGKVLVPDDGNTPLLNPASEVSVTAWIKFHRPPDDYTARVVVKGLEGHENYGLNVGKNSKAGFFVRYDPNEPNDPNNLVNNRSYSLGSNDMIAPIDEWVHIAGVFNGIDPDVYINVYINGDLADSDDPRDVNDANSIILLDSNEALAIGDAVDDDREFPGAVDDARIYDYALTDAEVAYIATEGTGYVPLVSIANLHDSEPAGQKAVNFKDYAELMKQWLNEKLWPL